MMTMRMIFESWPECAFLIYYLGGSDVRAIDTMHSVTAFLEYFAFMTHLMTRINNDYRTEFTHSRSIICATEVPLVRYHGV